MIYINGIDVPIELTRSSRKTMSIQIERNGKITLKLPLKASMVEAEKFVMQKRDWINKHLEIAAENRKKLSELVPFTGDEIREMAQRALAIIPERVAYYAKKIGVTYGSITVRNQKTRWGSCSSKGNLNFNCLLAAVPPEVLDSVVVHELCHRKHMDHSKAFYSEVYRAFPEYDKWNRWLKENGPALIARMTGQV